MSFWKGVLDVAVGAAKAFSEASVELHQEDHCLEIKPFGLMGVKKVITSRYPCITELQFGNELISITMEKFFLSHTIEISYARLQVQGGVVHVGVQLEEGFPYLLRGIGGQIVATVINLLMGGFQEDPPSVEIQNDVVVYHLPTSQLGLISQVALNYGIQNIDLHLAPRQYSVWIQYPEDLQINPTIGNFLSSTLQGYKRLED